MKILCPKRARLLVASCLLVLQGGAAPVLASTFDVDQSIAFADVLAESGEYYRAVTEYRRALFLLDNDRSEKRLHALLGVGRAYYDGGEFANSALWCREHLAEARDRPTWPEFQKVTLLATIESGEIDLALNLAGQDPGEVSDVCAAVAHAHRGEWAEASSLFRGLEDGRRFRSVARRDAEVAEAAFGMGRKSPGLAAGLSLVPGLGYLYSGQGQSALSAFVINTLLIGSAVSAYRNSMIELGAVLSFFGVGWYGGNIYGAYYSAIRYNDWIDRRHLERLDY